jgi:DNA invertase Pin-like site-specific DNA recombinase
VSKIYTLKTFEHDIVSRDNPPMKSHKVHTGILNAAIYARVSSRDQRTIPDQLSDMKKYAEIKGWTITAEAFEKESGKRDTRPARYDLIQRAWKHEFDVIMVWKLDRWGRNIRDLVNTIYDLHEQGVAFVSVQDNIDLTTTNGKLMFHILAAIAQWERETIVSRVRAGVSKAKARGVRLGRPPTTRSQTGKVRRLAAEGCNKAQIARQCGISRASVLRILLAPKSGAKGL